MWAVEKTPYPSLRTTDQLYGDVGHNNGNLAFVAGAKHLFENEIVFTPWHTSPEKLKELGDIIYIPCANQLGPHTDLGGLATNLEKAQLPVVAVGLGAQTRDINAPIILTEGTKRWVHTISSLCKGKNNILTRGVFTSEFLSSLNIQTQLPSSCPSLFINADPFIHKSVSDNSSTIPRRIAVCAGHQSWSDIKHIERQLVALLSDAMYPGSYIVQSMKDMIKISLGSAEVNSIDHKILDKIISFTRPEMSKEQFIDWCSRYAYSFYDVGTWMAHLKRHDFVVGARYHGTALGIQAGVPSLCITVDSRTAELCQSSCVPSISAAEVHNLDRESIHKHFVAGFKPVSFFRNRLSKAKQYVNFLSSNGLTPSRHLLDISQASDDTVSKQESKSEDNPVSAQ